MIPAFLPAGYRYPDAARDLEATAQNLGPGERITVHRMPVGEARRILVEQETGDGRSWAALVLLDRYLGRPVQRHPLG